MLKVAFYPEVNGPVRGTPHVTEALLITFVSSCFQPFTV